MSKLIPMFLIMLIVEANQVTFIEKEKSSAIPSKRFLALPTSLPPIKYASMGCPITDPYFIKEYAGPMTED